MLTKMTSQRNTLPGSPGEGHEVAEVINQGEDQVTHGITILKEQWSSESQLSTLFIVFVLNSVRRVEDTKPGVKTQEGYSYCFRSEPIPLSQHC